MSAAISILWALAIPACCVASIWTQDLRWFGTAIILAGTLVLLNMLPKTPEDKP